MGGSRQHQMIKIDVRRSRTHSTPHERNDSSQRIPIQTTGRVKNKAARSVLYRKLQQQKKLEKRAARKSRQSESNPESTAKVSMSPRQVPKTIENQRVRDETHVKHLDEDNVEELANDEFAKHFSGMSSPKVMITTNRKPSGEMFRFLENIFWVVPNAYYYARRAYHVQEVITHAGARGFTDLLVFNENRKFSQGAKVNGLLHVHLPGGPSCLYRLSSLVLTKKIRNHGRATKHYPELILNNFSTRLGHRIGRMLMSVFPQRPEFQGRRVVTFHNQRDFIFFRHHRYIFEVQKGAEPRQELCELEQSTKFGEIVQGVVKGHQLKTCAKDTVDNSTKKQDLPEEINNITGSTLGNGSSFRARLQELGPRLTLKLMSVQNGIFDSKHGEYEYVRCRQADGSKLDRRKFVL